MRKKEQAQREQIKVKEIADVIEDVLQGEPTGKKFYDKIKDRIDKAIRKLKIKEVGESLSDSIALYYTANEQDQLARDKN